MGKDPAFLFYPNDWLGGTIGMTFEEKGAYMELLMMQFNRGHMTEHMIGQVVGQNWNTLKSKFIQDENGLWYNVRLEEEKNKRQAYTESRRNNKSGFNQYTKKLQKESGHMTKHMIPHMENENVNENKDGIKDKNEKPKIEIPTLEEFLNYLQTEMPNWGFDFNSNKFYLKTKYETWVSNGWKDGNGNKIKSWKLKAKNQMPYLPNSKPIIAKSDGIYGDINKNYKQL